MRKLTVIKGKTTALGKRTEKGMNPGGKEKRQ